MGMKKGIFFTIDSILAAGIILTIIVFVSSIYINENPNFQLNYLSQDLSKTLSSLKVKDSDNGYIKDLINDGTIKNKENTVLEQIGEFWADNKLDLANKTASNITVSLVPSNIGFGIWINNQTIYSKDIPLKKTLITSKTLVSGIQKGQVITSYSRKNPPSLFGPVIIEVRAWQ